MNSVVYNIATNQNWSQSQQQFISPCTDFFFQAFQFCLVSTIYILIYRIESIPQVNLQGHLPFLAAKICGASPPRELFSAWTYHVFQMLRCQAAKTTSRSTPKGANGGKNIFRSNIEMCIVINRWVKKREIILRWGEKFYKGRWVTVPRTIINFLEQQDLHT